MRAEYTKKGIAIVGLNGGGKSTIAHALAAAVGYFEMDVEDYYFPEQRASRKWSLDNDSIIDTDYLGELPFSVPRNKAEVEAALREDLSRHPEFIMAGVTVNWSPDILARLDIAFYVKTPLEERIRRIQYREEKRFGSRILEGGDMYCQQKEFRELIRSKEEKTVEDSIAKLSCPIIILDGSLPVKENIDIILSHLK